MKTDKKPGGQRTRAAPDARSMAHAALADILGKGDTVERALDGRKEYRALAPRERAFARLILLTTLRRFGEIDTVIDRFMDRPLRPRRASARHAMRIAAAQLLFLDTPPHAAVSSAVDQVRANRNTAPLSGLANAVLRRIADGGEALLKDVDADRVNMPDWLWERLTAAHGEPAVRAIAAMNRQEPPLDITVKDPAEREHWARALDAARLPSGSLRLGKSGQVSELPGFADGAWWVQDAAAALPARILGDVAGQQVIDLCAAPGGKAAQLAAAGADVIAVDSSAPRLERLGENFARLGLHAKTVAADAVTWRPDTLADAVLLDAPCSATGTMRRHPEVPWTRNADDTVSLAARQDALLDAAGAMIGPGGRLVYAVCSLDPAEGEERIAAFLARHPGMIREGVDITALGAPVEALTDEGDLRTLPSHWQTLGGLDGFYAACLRRRS